MASETDHLLSSLEVIAGVPDRTPSLLVAAGEVLDALPALPLTPRAVPSIGAWCSSAPWTRRPLPCREPDGSAPTAVALGQEAVLVGVARAMRDDDVLFPTYRDNGALLWRGVTRRRGLHVLGRRRARQRFQGPRGDFPICIPVGSRAPHAAGRRTPSG